MSWWGQGFVVRDSSVGLLFGTENQCEFFLCEEESCECLKFNLVIVLYVIMY